MFMQNCSAVIVVAPLRPTTISPSAPAGKDKGSTLSVCERAIPTKAMSTNIVLSILCFILLFVFGYCNIWKCYIILCICIICHYKLFIIYLFCNNFKCTCSCTSIPTPSIFVCWITNYCTLCPR